MNKYDFDDKDAIEDKADKIHRIANQLHSMTKRIRFVIPVRQQTLVIMINNIRGVLYQWTRLERVGRQKDLKIQKAYNAFFQALYDWLMTLRDCCSNEESQAFVNESLFQGVVYRYLGHPQGSEDIDKKIIPYENSSWVSWSKNDKNVYIKGKLIGVKTHMVCNITGMCYGISLDAFGISLNDESEVVFPTKLELITLIEYLDK